MAISTKNAPTSGTTRNERGDALHFLVVAVMMAIAVGVAPMAIPEVPGGGDRGVVGAAQQPEHDVVDQHPTDEGLCGKMTKRGSATAGERRKVQRHQRHWRGKGREKLRR